MGGGHCHDARFAEQFVRQDVDRYLALVSVSCQSLFDRDTIPGAEPEELLALKLPALILPGHTTSMRLPAPGTWRSVSPAPSIGCPSRIPTTKHIRVRILEFSRDTHQAGCTHRSYAFVSALPEPSPLAAEGWSLTRVGFFQTRHHPNALLPLPPGEGTKNRLEKGLGREYTVLHTRKHTEEYHGPWTAGQTCDRRRGEPGNWQSHCPGSWPVKGLTWPLRPATKEPLEQAARELRQRPDGA